MASTKEFPRWITTQTKGGITRKYITIPDTMAEWPWPRKIHPAFDESVSKESYDWLNYHKPLSPQTQKAFNKGKIDLLTALAYTEGSRELLRLSIDILHAFFLVDSYTDNFTAPVVRETVDFCIDASVHPDKPRPIDEPPLGELLRDCFLRSREMATPLGLEHWTNSWVRYLNSMVDEATDRDSHHTYTIDEYIVKRRLFIAAIPCFAVGAMHVSIPHEVWNHPHVEKLRNLSSDLVMVDNDIASWNKEQASEAEPCNILTIAMNQLGLDFDGAMNWAIQLHKELLDNFIKGMDEVPSFGADVDAALGVYLDHVRGWPYAMMLWNYESGRYFGNSFDPVARTVPLLPKLANVRLGEEVEIVDVDEALRKSESRPT